MMSGTAMTLRVPVREADISARTRRACRLLTVSTSTFSASSRANSSSVMDGKVSIIRLLLDRPVWQCAYSNEWNYTQAMKTDNKVPHVELDGSIWFRSGQQNWKSEERRALLRATRQEGSITEAEGRGGGEGQGS